jgi:hypothetical protein
MNEQLSEAMYQAQRELPSIGAPRGWIVCPDGPHLYIMRRVLAERLSAEDRAQLAPVDTTTGRVGARGQA